MPPSDNDRPLHELPTVGPAAPSVNAPASTGENFDGYLLQCELGRGGMGIVFKAFEPGLGRFVALKMALSGAIHDDSELLLFKSEASAAARLTHPNIVKVHRVGQHAGCPYFSMDYIAGPSLSQRLAEGPLPSRIAARYLSIVARAIQHAHEQGILHRDLKPSNILLDADDQPHVADFGLAKQLSGDRGQTRTGALMGTPSYMAPEQAAGSKDLTPATDVYGLGALLYELITARPPFRGETPFDTVLQVLHNDPAPPRLLNPRVERDVETICLKCLAKHPRDRYPSALAVADDLDRYLSGETIQARSLNMLDYVGRALERSHFDVEFRAYSQVILWFAVIVALMHVVEHVLIVKQMEPVLIRGGKFLQFALMVLVVWFYRAGRLAPGTNAERLLWSVWIGYVAACSTIGHLLSERFGIEVAYQGVLYPIFCTVTGMAFLVLGSSYWGMCYAFALIFFAAAFLLQHFPSWGTIVFGGLWTLALVAIAFRLRRLGSDRANDRAT